MEERDPSVDSPPTSRSGTCIMDQSYMEPGISVNFFAEDMTKLPHVRSIGDIISLQNVEATVVSSLRHIHTPTSRFQFQLYKSKLVRIHREDKSAKYHASDHDDEFLSQLRTWLLDNPPKAVGNDVPLLLCRIKLDLAFDLVRSSSITV
ncbi:hypothetical protein OPV22_024873 [Ensete ventricosum]|uniref:Telomeric single stranded DNA binding POT1/Cdc13 domain-containing protein n=1 Tax=Ensete ventricosum TaxID=4639 RepID=A0AAV8Q8A6_ENSVE|nr:hypothetical protein OPV22_024873 [Ensete ventricosum]